MLQTYQRITRHYMRSGGITRIFINLFIFFTVVALNSCCMLPLVNCVPKVKEYNVRPEVLEFKNSLVRSCIVKAWQLSSRDKRYTDTTTVDVTIRFSYNSSLNLDTIDPNNIFIRGNHYLKVGDEQILFKPIITKNTNPRKSDPAFEEIEYHLFARVQESFLNTNEKTLVIKDLNFFNKLKDDLDIEVMLYER